MPQKTFTNLSNERKTEILNACFEEFALNDFESASLSRIISRLGLAKGSFYRYFESKQDLYSYLNQFAGELVVGNLVRCLDGTSGDFFEDWTDFVLSLRDIEQDYPMVIRFRFKAALEQRQGVEANQDLQKVQGRTKLMSSIIRKYQDSGSLRKDIDLDFFSLMMTFFNFALAEHIAIQQNLTPNSPIFALDSEKLRGDVANLLRILKQGAAVDEYRS